MYQRLLAAEHSDAFTKNTTLSPAAFITEGIIIQRQQYVLNLQIAPLSSKLLHTQEAPAS